LPFGFVNIREYTITYHFKYADSLHNVDVEKIDESAVED
jgi:hypothetical protein